MNNVTKIEYLNIMINEDLKNRFTTICEEKSIDSSALIRNWIEGFVTEQERPLISMDLLDIVWKLNKTKEQSINQVCCSVANLLVYDGCSDELFHDLAAILLRRAKDQGCFEVSDGTQRGKVIINGENVYFMLKDSIGEWSTESLL